MKTLKAIRTITIYTASLAVGIGGLIYGIPWMKNIFLFLQWMAVVFNLLTFIVFSVKKDIKVPERATPKWIMVLYGVSEICLLVAFGYFALASFVLITWILAAAVLDELRKEQNTL